MEHQLKPSISFAICTYNRASIIGKCLQSILEQNQAVLKFEVLIIDNNSTDDTQAVVETFIQKHDNFRYIKEKKQGLSYARNRAIKEASGEWIVYTDDDAIIASDYLERLHFIITNYNFDGFGGEVNAWFLHDRPKWIPERFETHTPPLAQKIDFINGNNGWLIGCNMVFKKEVLKRVGGFDTNLGMKGDIIDYGEDDFIQQKMIGAGYKLGFDPQLEVSHLVRPQKLQLSWHFASAIAKGRTWRKMRSTQKYSLIRDIFSLIISIVGLFLRRLPIAIYKWVMGKDFYWQNLLLETISPIFHYAGRIQIDINMKK